MSVTLCSDRLFGQGRKGSYPEVFLIETEHSLQPTLSTSSLLAVYGALKLHPVCVASESLRG